MNQVFTVEGMSCAHCEKAVTKAILSVDPQAQVRIDRSHDQVDVMSDKSRDDLTRAIADEGYRVSN
jgi:copper chaperone